MNKSLNLQPKFYFIFGFYCLLFYSGNAQTFKYSIKERYEKIEKSIELYSTKIKEINKLLELEKSSIDSVQLSHIYSSYSKLNYKNKDYKNAIINGCKAIEIQKEFIDSLPQLVNNTYHNLAYYYASSGDKTNAIKSFETLINQPFKGKFTVKAYTEGLAQLFIERGDYYKLLDYLREAEYMIIKRNNIRLNKELYRVYLSISGVYSKINETEDYYKAIEYLKKTEKIITHLSGQELIKTKIIIYNRYGSIYDELKDFDKAICHYNKALYLSLNLEKSDSLNIAKIYNNLGYIHMHGYKPEIAYKYYQKALEYAPFHASVFDNLGDYFLQQKKYVQALTHYQKAINYNIDSDASIDYKKLPSIEVFLSSINKIDLVNDLKDKANAWLQFYLKTKNKEYLKHALATTQRADELIDIIRFESYEQQSKFFWRKKGVDLYILATAICYHLNESEKAFYFMEKSKSLSLLENLNHEEAKKLGGLSDTLQEQEYSIKHDVLFASQKILTDTFTKEDRRSLIFRKKRKYEEFLKSLEKDYPSYYNYKKEVNLISYKEAQQKIKESNISMVQYILSENEGYGMYMSFNTSHLFRVPNVAILQKEIRTLNKLLHEPLFSIEDQNTYKIVSFSIFKKLFPFIEDPKVYKNNKMVIIPDHKLQYVPFETLVTSLDSMTLEDNNLINYLEISYLYSMSLSKNIDEVDRFPSKNFIGFAPIHFKKHELVDLKLSEKKMMKIRSLFNGNMLTEKKASKSNFIKISSAYKTIHLSTHANSMSDQDPWIAFYDEKLYLNELYFIKNQAELVVLDACKTGIGVLRAGEGIMSINRGFFHAGTKSVVSSLWNTNEKSSNEIILNFYSYLKKGISKSSALRRAKLDYMRNHQGSETSPFFWGALVLHGNTDSIQLSVNTQTSLWIYILVVGLLLLGIAYMKKKL
ncbi:hypothetical protein A8C32_15025 [Flavivirga aquatica]|uniref:CHAT domain-containing protein n=1 Tax=Flavivirga aquatica TaxID=1849968 RepID=A0A1E5T913_9FLAO|nr:CHAT domain-containing protein [Flavivirga aquatica]OEK07797.1 hypothetical protein A8C32_15025 [Flavivirga aquatica]